MPDFMPALTVRQPWGSAIILGGKTPENRPRRMAYRGPLLIHAGLKIDWDAPSFAWRAVGLKPPPSWARGRGISIRAWTDRLGLGVILGQVTVTGCHYGEDNPVDPLSPLPLCTRWAQRDQWHIELADPVPLGRPVPCKGALGLWRLPDDTEAAVRVQLPANFQLGRDLEVSRG